MPRRSGRAPGLPHPNRMFRYLAAVATLIVAASVWLTLQMPASSVSFSPSIKSQTITVGASEAQIIVDLESLVVFRPPAGPAIRMTAERAASVPHGISDADFRISESLSDGPVGVEVRDAHGGVRRFEIVRSSRGPGDLSASYWLSIIVSLLALLLGIGVWVLRPRDRRAVAYLTGALGLALGQITYAVGPLVDLATGRAAFVALIWANTLGLHLLAASMVLLFVGFPARLLSRRTENGLLILVGVPALAAVAIVPWKGPVYSPPLLMALFLLMAGLIALQGWLGRRDADRRTPLMIVVAAVLLGTAIYFVVSLLPSMFAWASPIDPAAAVPIFLLIYASIGVAIAQRSAIVLNGWVRNALVSVCLVGLVLLLDVLLIGLLSQQSGVALGLAFAIVALVYLPVREWFGHRADRRRQAQARRTLRLATDLAFATQGAVRVDRWRDAVSATFDPLDLATDPRPGSKPRIGERGVALHLPPVAGAPALIARHANAGQRLFVASDVESAEALIEVIERLVEARDAYMQGASEERQRIARDLHDDVSGRLMTSLHRKSADAMRHDVREAMADIRTIVNGLAAEPRALGELLADVRHESLARLEASGIALAWPPGPDLADPRPLDYPVYRHLVSVLRECVSNVVRHSGASRVSVSVNVDGDLLSIEVADDGKGIRADAEPGNGLLNCARRAEALGGHFEIVPVQDGSAVRFRMTIPGAVPVPANAAAS